MRKPRKLAHGSRIAIVSPSWGGPALFPEVYENGLRNLKELFGFEVVEFSTARKDPRELYLKPQLRAEDLNLAFQDPSIEAIFASIGGDDSIRLLPYLNVDSILENPKILLGYSDTTAILASLNVRGLNTFSGPTVMAGWSQIHNFPLFVEDCRKKLTCNPSRTLLRSFPAWADGYPDWGTENHVGKINPLQRNEEGWVWLQGRENRCGQLWGGCLEVLEFLKGTEFWPHPDFWQGRILFLETSEDKPLPRQVGYFLRNLGMQGILQQLSGLLIGRPCRYSPAEKQELYRQILQILMEEFLLPELPVVANLDFGHTDPNMIIPYGLELEIDPQLRTLTIQESWFVNEERTEEVTPG